MFITADQLILHTIGDYVIQSDWMANEKTKKHFAAVVHATTYSLPFFLLSPSNTALVVILSTHYIIDRYRLARYVCWLKNFVAPRHIEDTVDVLPFNRTQHTIMRRNYPWSECSATGYHKDRPAWMSVWLMIIVDNLMHVLINGAALKWL